MKKRILSFLLVLVMLFSCLSLNIFAAEGENTEATEETTITEAEQYQKYGIGLPGGLSLTQSQVKDIVGANSIATDELSWDTAYNNPFGFKYNSNFIIRLETGDQATDVLNTYDASSGKTDVGIVDWRQIAFYEEGANDYLKWQKPEALDSEGQLISVKYATHFVDKDEDGVAETEEFKDKTLQEYVNGKRKMWIYATIDNGVATSTTSMNIYEFTVANIKAYFAMCLEKEEADENGSKVFNLSDGYTGKLYYKGYMTSEYLAYNNTYDSTLGAGNHYKSYAGLDDAGSKIGDAYTFSFKVRTYGNYDITPIETREYSMADFASKIGYETVKIEADGDVYAYKGGRQGHRPDPSPHSVHRYRRNAGSNPLG